MLVTAGEESSLVPDSPHRLGPDLERAQDLAALAVPEADKEQAQVSAPSMLSTQHCLWLRGDALQGTCSQFTHSRAKVTTRHCPEPNKTHLMKLRLYNTFLTMRSLGLQ